MTQSSPPIGRVAAAERVVAVIGQCNIRTEGGYLSNGMRVRTRAHEQPDVVTLCYTGGELIGRWLLSIGDDIYRRTNDGAWVPAVPSDIPIQWADRLGWRYNPVSGAWEKVR